MKNQPRKQNRNTEYPEGVFAARKKNGDLYFRSSLTCRRKHISLGSYATPELAHLAYLEGRALLSDHRYTLEKFSETSPLPFSKWVSLINYRDNGIYIGNPIYAGSRILYYYLSPSLVLKFDAEDLFYCRSASPADMASRPTPERESISVLSTGILRISAGKILRF